MDKELIIRVINAYYSVTRSMNDISLLIGLYCHDRGKKDEEIIELLRILPSLPFHEMVRDAISWYAKELNLTIINIIDKNNQLKPIKIYE